jgi:lipopolysaccharide biosynthesis glycosyltransferase
VFINKNGENMTKKLVLQLNIPDSANGSKFAFRYIKEMYETSEKFAKSYAKITGADYYKISELGEWQPAKDKHVAFQKLKVYDLIEYDQIFYIDSDYIIKNNAPDIFNLCRGKFSACLETYPIAEKLAANIHIPTNKYMNSGMIHFTKEVLDLTRDSVLNYLDNDWEYMDQGLINKLFFDSKIDFYQLDPNQWNPAFQCFGLYADHYAGTNKKRWGERPY